MRPPIIRFPRKNEVFYGETPVATRVDPFLGCADDTELSAKLIAMFQDSVRAKAAEVDRLRRMTRFYDGFPYREAYLNKQRPITNYCFSVVETVVPVMTESRPRPQIVPREAMGSQAVKDLQKFATWLMSRADFDEWNILSTRDCSIYGYSPSIPAFDYRTGMPYPKTLSVFDTYYDETARSVNELEHAFIAKPVSVPKLRGYYPAHANLITADGIASPSLEAIEQAFFENADFLGGGALPPTITALVCSIEGQSASGATSWYTRDGESQSPRGTAFLVQAIVRDDRLREIEWMGRLDKHGDDGSIEQCPGETRSTKVPHSKNGWRIITFTYRGGKILMNTEADPAYDGMPLLVRRRYPRTDRIYNAGDLDHVIPIQKQILGRDYLLFRALDVQGNPVLLTNEDSGLPADKETVDGGDILRIRRGSEARWLDARGPSEHQFDMRVINARDVDTISGVQDVTQGQRPAGIEASSAIAQLREAAATRMRGFGVLEHIDRGRMLKRLMVGAGRKLTRWITFHTPGGERVTLDPESLLMEYDIDFAEGSGNAPGKQEIEEKAWALYERGVIDEPALLETLDWMGRDEILQQAAARQARGGSASGGGR